MPLSYKEKGVHTRTVRTHGLVTQYCGNGALTDLDSGITAFNLFNTKFLEGLTLCTNIGWRDTNIADAATTRCSTSPTTAPTAEVLGAQIQQMPDLQRVVGAALSSA
jgi:diacylglycerol O-acyltransferase / trehalose O-mycolyltransferase